MTDASKTAEILAFAAHIDSDDNRSPDAIAKSRNWLDADGKPTEEGLELVAALEDQEDTRTVLRGNF